MLRDERRNRRKKKRWEGERKGGIRWRSRREEGE